MKQLLVYGDLIREEANLPDSRKSNFQFVLGTLQRAMTRIGVEAITESMGSLLKQQYQTNQNINTLMVETQILYNCPDFNVAGPFIDQALKVYMSQHNVKGRGGAFLKHPVRRKKRQDNFEDCPTGSTVINNRKLRNKFGIAIFEDKTFLKNLCFSE